jgi:hypothetical protein
MNEVAPTGGQAAPASPGATAPGSFTQRIAFEQPGIVPGLQGCSGIARLGLCIRCDRLYQPGPQIHAAAKRVLGLYECGNQVVGGVHVTSIPRESGAAQTVKQGGEVVTTPANGG